MNLDHFVLDTDTLLALGGDKQVSALIHIASGDASIRLWVPIISALEAERQRAGIIDYIGILDTLHTLDADYEAAHSIANLHRRGVPYGVAAAVHSARATLSRPEGALVATVVPGAYDELGVPVMDLNR
ncbi:hypothetical protein B7755_024680 [Streptomyces sp. NBS 14/10]|uniref:hypothetical protein n=1 Tax=Streptomyces sp. NBS 14/10 TaxID=1945643 RepID=UPI000B7C7624|nr:hypothetical protein [Streptomyces sp. NBS 14/10]KAK1181052.1 hypothetical protein B7755_024680 [Streptomyces sp. NBS 14/10]